MNYVKIIRYIVDNQIQIKIIFHGELSIHLAIRNA